MEAFTYLAALKDPVELSVRLNRYESKADNLHHILFRLHSYTPRLLGIKYQSSENTNKTNYIFRRSETNDVNRRLGENNFGVRHTLWCSTIADNFVVWRGHQKIGSEMGEEQLSGQDNNSVWPNFFWLNRMV